MITTLSRGAAIVLMALSAFLLIGLVLVGADPHRSVSRCQGQTATACLIGVAR